MKVASGNWWSLIREGSGYWKYAPVADGVRFLTWYDYEVRFGRLGRAADAAVFRPLIGWATAWSFDRLALWLEVAPDYPGYGHSDWPDPKQFDYTFDHIASVMDGFTQALGLSHYTLYMQDYDGPLGFRMALAHPERVQALIVQDAVSHNEGLGPATLDKHRRSCGSHSGFCRSSRQLSTRGWQGRSTVPRRQGISFPIPGAATE